MENQQQPNSEVKKVIWVAVKEAARERIGQPPPTKVRGNSKGGRRSDGRHRAGVTGALDIYDPRAMEEEQLPDAPRMATNPAHRGGAITNIPSKYLHDVRQRRHDTETLFHFSPEATAHANYLQRTQGDQAMNQYLKEIKERKMDHLDLAKAGQLADEKKQQNVTGNFEEQLQQSEAKAKHFREQAGLMEKQADEQDRIALKLREILDIMGGRSARTTRTPSGKPRVEHGEWDRRWKEHASTPISVRDLTIVIVEKYQVHQATAYQAVNKAKEKGKLAKVGGGLVQYAPPKDES